MKMRTNRPGEARNRLRLLAATSGACAMLSIPSTAWATQCTVNFDNRNSLNNSLGQARLTFAEWSTRDAEGGLEYCSSGDISQCWGYLQLCGSFTDINVFPEGINHFHLGFEDNAIYSGNFCDPGDGQGSGFAFTSSPVCPDWAGLARVLYSHDVGYWIDVFVQQETTVPGHAASLGSPQQFSLSTVGVGSQPIQLWYELPDGSWFGWDNLGANTNWNVNISGVIEVQISNAAGATGSAILNFLNIGT